MHLIQNDSIIQPTSAQILGKNRDAFCEIQTNIVAIGPPDPAVRSSDFQGGVKES